MWNERQRAQKIQIELERVKRELREQNTELDELMEACGEESKAQTVESGRGSPVLLPNTFVSRA